ALSDRDALLAHDASLFEEQAMRTIETGQGAQILSGELQKLDDVLEAGGRSHATAAAAAAGPIERWRRHSAAVSYGLHGAAAALALLALFGAVRISRAHNRLIAERAAAVEERNRLMERRAEELEMFAARVAHDLKNPLGAIALRVLS